MKSTPPFARKRFGQHFLQDRTIAETIVSAANPDKGEHVLEIGPGRGAITSKILERGASLTAVEIDRDLAQDLRRRFGKNVRFHLVEADVLNSDWRKLVRMDRKNKIIANLPFNISTPLFFRIVSHRSLFDSVTIMLQRELALRIRHSGREKNLKDYGILSVVANTVFRTRTICNVPAACFSPKPKVDAAVVQLQPKSIDIPDETAFFDFVKRAFNQRRKMLLSFLRKNEKALLRKLPQESVAHLTRLRPENLSPTDYFRLFHEYRLL